MTVPYANQGCGPMDNFNFFHSQVWINIECALKILTNHWCILKNALSSALSINKVVVLTSCLCCLHNFCIDNGSAKVSARYKHDVLMLMDFTYVPVGDSQEDISPVGLLGGANILRMLMEGEEEQQPECSMTMKELTKMALCPE